MGCLMGKFDKWAEYEDEETTNYLKKHYGPLVQISLIFPSYKRSMLPITLLTFAVHTFLLGTHVVLLLITVQRTVVYWDLEMASLAVHFALLIAVSLFTIYFIPSKRKIFSTQTKMSANDVGRYRTGRIYDEDWCVKELKRNKKETMYFLALPVCIGIGTTVVLTLPYIMKWINGMETPYSPGMVTENLPFPCWYPFPTHEGALHGMAVMGQFTVAGCVAAIVVQLLLFLLVNSQRIRFELRVIGYSLQTILPRAMKLYLQMNPEKNRADVRIRDPAYQRVVELCLIDSVAHHHTTLELISLYAEQLDVIGFLAYSIGTGVIGMSLFNILKALNSKNYASIILFSIMLVCETLTVFVISLFGEAITSQTIVLRDQLYYSRWDNFDDRNRKILLNFHTAMTEPLVISVMGLITLSLDTFSSIMNTAYSFFNLMNTQPGE